MRDEVPDRRGAGERHRVDLPIEQHAVDVRSAFALRARRRRAIGDDVDDVGARLAQRVGEQISRAMSARGSRKRLPVERADGLERLDDRLGAELGRRQVDADAVPRDPRRRRRPDGADAHALELADVAVASSRSMKYSTPLALVKTIQSNVPASAQARSSASSILRRLRSRIVGAGIASAPRSSSISMSSPACSRDRVTTMRLPKSGRSSNQRRCSRKPRDRADDQQRRAPSRACRSAMSPSVPCDGLAATAACRRR